MNDDQYSNYQGQDGAGALPSMPMQNNTTGSGPVYQAVQQDSLDLQTQISSLPPEANDLDLIEKEWVTHLKYIVTQTSEDPFLQQAEISKAKADYMRKRYNKDVKISEG